MTLGTHDVMLLTPVPLLPKQTLIANGRSDPSGRSHRPSPAALSPSRHHGDHVSSQVCGSTSRVSRVSVTSRTPDRTFRVEPSRTVAEHTCPSASETTRVVPPMSFASPPPARATGVTVVVAVVEVLVARTVVEVVVARAVVGAVDVAVVLEVALLVEGDGDVAGESEADIVDMSWTKAPNVNAPIMDDASVAFELEVHSFVDLDTSVLTIGEVKAIHLDPTIMADDGMADFKKLNPLSKLGRQQWGKTEDFV